MGLITFLILVLSSSPERSFDNLQIPPGFTKQLIATEPQIMDPVAFCFDDDGNILVAESFRQEQGVEDNRSSAFWLGWDLGLQSVDSRLAMYKHYADQRVNGMEYYSEYEDRIRLLKDKDGDGVYETASIFADGFNEPLDGTGAGLIAFDGTVLYTCIPHLWSFSQDDGVAFNKKSLFGNVFGVRTALRGHDMHGLALGLDGRLYWSIGDRGYHIELENGTVLHSPGEGAVFRCELDGSNLDVYHHGLRNPQELAFDSYGNLFTADNNSDSVDKARLVYCVEGGETGWRMEYQTLQGANERGPWVQENGWDPHAQNRPAWILPAIDTIGSGPSGLVAYPGAGFSDRYKDHFFLCDFRGGAEHSNVLSFSVKPEGAHFQLDDLHPFAEKLLCTDVDFGYNGKMVISDWGEGWTGNYEGRLYSVWEEEYRAEGDVSDIFSKGFSNLPTNELIEFLSHIDRRVRIRAQFALANREVVNELEAALATKNQLAKIHVMWTLAMLHRCGQMCMDGIVPLLKDTSPEIRAQACKILGEASHTASFEQIVELINDPSPRVSYFATIASGYLGNAKDAIIAMLERNDDEDVYLRHAAVVALSKIQYASSMANLQNHPSSAVRLAAVLVLRRMKSNFLADYLEDEDDAVATEAARAIHDGRVRGKAFEQLAESILYARTIPWQKRAISANKMLHGCAESVRVAGFAADASKSNSMRILAIQSLRDWVPNSSVNRDIVEGRVIEAKQTDFYCIEGIEYAVEQLCMNANGELLLETLRFAHEQTMKIPEKICSELVLDKSAPIQIRAYALQKSNSVELVEYALQSNHWQLRAAARDVLLKMADPTAEDLLLETINSGEVFEAQEAIKSLKGNEEALLKIDKQTFRNELQLEYAEIIQNASALNDEWLVIGGNPALGKKVVFENSKSECLRCHTIEGKGGIAGPSLDDVGSRLDGTQMLHALVSPNLEITEGFGEYSAMPPMGTLLNERELRDVVAYLTSLQAAE